MSNSSTIVPLWLSEWMAVRKITLWGAADLRDFSTPRDETGQRFPFALSWAIPMNPYIMASIQNGPNQAYADEYASVNSRINELSVAIAAEIKARGFRSRTAGGLGTHRSGKYKRGLSPQNCGNKSRVGLGRSSLSAYYAPFRIMDSIGYRFHRHRSSVWAHD